MSTSSKSTSCSNPGCIKPSNYVAEKRCSACHRTRYCSTDCSKMDWAEHKGKCFSEKNINAMLDRMDAEKAAKPVPRPSKKRCTGCGIQFPKYDEDEDECDEDYLADACDDCGYMCCEGCVSHHSRGSCHCRNSNFGRPYCRMAPAWYHMGRGGSYVGDRHPEEEMEANPEAFENCREVKFCLKKEYL